MNPWNDLLLEHRPEPVTKLMEIMDLNWIPIHHFSQKKIQERKLANSILNNLADIGKLLTKR